MKSIEEICKSAGTIIHFLKSNYSDENSSNGLLLLALASGIAGVACYEASMALGSEFKVVNTSIGETFYFSDKANEFLLESQYSLRSCILGFYQQMMPDKPLPSIESAIVKISTSIGDKDYKICDVIDPRSLYKNSINCWKVIHENEFNPNYEPADWPFVMGIVIQNLFGGAREDMSLEMLCQFSFECACYLSKIGPDTYSTNI